MKTPIISVVVAVGALALGIAGVRHLVHGQLFIGVWSVAMATWYGLFFWCVVVRSPASSPDADDCDDPTDL